MRALSKYTWTEIKLFFREPVGAFFTLVFPLMMLFLFGTIYGNDPSPYLNGYGSVDVSVPAYTAMIIGTTGIMGLSITMSTYREKGILRRLQVTPIRPQVILFAQVVVACGEDRIERDQADQLAAGDAHADPLRLGTGRVEDLMDPGDLVVHQVERDLGPPVFLDVPSAALQVREHPRHPQRLAALVPHDLASGVSFELSRLAQLGSDRVGQLLLARVQVQVPRDEERASSDRRRPASGVELRRTVIRREVRILQLLRERLVLAVTDVR